MIELRGENFEYRALKKWQLTPEETVLDGMACQLPAAITFLERLEELTDSDLLDANE